MSTAHPDSYSPDRMVKVQVLQSVEEVNARGPMSAADFEVFAAHNGRCELLKGNVKMMSPAGSEHGFIANEIAFLLTAQVRQRKLGRVYAAETGFVIERGPDTVRAPDVAFISNDRVPEFEGRGFGTIMPDLVVEVASPSDTENDIAEKTNAWIEAGIRCVVNVYPETQTATVHRAGKMTAYEEDDIVDLGDIVDDWKPVLSTFFGVSS